MGPPKDAIDIHQNPTIMSTKGATIYLIIINIFKILNQRLERQVESI